MKEDRNYPFNLLDGYFCEYNHITADTPYEIVEIEAKKLIIPQRIDLAVKYNYIRARETKLGFEEAKQLYENHITAFSDGWNLEHGNQEKASLEDYVRIFNQLIDDIKKNGWNPSCSMVPIGRNNELLDGAHRTACAAYFGQNITAVRFSHLSVKYDYQFFRKRLMTQVDLGQMIRLLCELRKDIRGICIWPQGYSKAALEQVETTLHKRKIAVVAFQDWKMDWESFVRIIRGVYQKESWLGNSLDRYHGARVKAKSCYVPRGKMRLYFVQIRGDSQLIAWKEEIRNYYQREKRTVHSVETKKDTLTLWDVFYQAQEKDKTISMSLSIKRECRFIYTGIVRKIKKIIGRPV